MSEGNSIQSWHVGIRGDYVALDEASRIQGTVAGGITKNVGLDLEIDFDLIGQFSSRRLLSGPLARLRWRPIENLEACDLAVATAVTAGKLGDEFNVRSGLGGEVGYALPIAGVDLRIYAGAEAGFILGGRQFDGTLYSGLAISFPIEADEKEKVSFPLVPPIVNEEPEKKELGEKEQMHVLSRVLSIEAEDRGDYVQALVYEEKFLERDPEQPYLRLLSLFLMRLYKEHGNISSEDLYAIRGVMDRALKHKRSSDIALAIRFFLQKSGLTLAELPERACVNVLIVIADLLELLGDKEVQAGGVLTRERFMREAKDRYFSSSMESGKRQALPMIRDGLDWFALIYLFLESDIKLVPDLYDDFGLSIESIIEKYRRRVGGVS